MLRDHRLFEGAAIRSPGELIASGVCLFCGESHGGLLPAPTADQEHREERCRGSRDESRRYVARDQEDGEDGGDERRLEQVDAETSRPELEEPTGMALENDQEATDGIHRDRGDHGSGGGCGRDRARERATADERQADEPGREPLEGRHTTFGADPTPHCPAVDQLGGDSGSGAEQGASDQSRKDDEGRRGGVPASGAELDDSLARRRRQREQRERDRRRAGHRYAERDDAERCAEESDGGKADGDKRAAGRVRDRC